MTLRSFRTFVAHYFIYIRSLDVHNILSKFALERVLNETRERIVDKTKYYTERSANKTADNRKNFISKPDTCPVIVRWRELHPLSRPSVKKYEKRGVRFV